MSIIEWSDVTKLLFWGFVTSLVVVVAAYTYFRERDWKAERDPLDDSSELSPRLHDRNVRRGGR